MKITQRNGKAAFTLIELMAVITIIVILAGLVVGGLGFVTERQAKEKAKVQIALLSKALEEYKLDMGTYPATSDKPANLTSANQNQNQRGTETSGPSLYVPLFYEGYDYGQQASPPATWPKATKIYLPDLDPTTTKQGWVTPPSGKPPVVPALTVILDPWGNQYCYRTATDSTGKANAATQNPDFDLWSMGKDGKTKPATAADASNRDDIKNF